MKSVHFGAGNIGRGFLGQLYFESGYETTFVDVVQDVVSGLQTRHAYPLRIVGEHPKEIQIERVTAVHAGDTDRVAQVIAEADLASTAVGVNVLPKVAPAIAQGIARRFAQADAAPIDFIVCENLIDAGPFLREQVRSHLDARWHDALDSKVGFVEASIGRMVPLMSAEQRLEDPLLVCVEEYCELPVDAHGFKGPVPPLAHLLPKANFKAYVERKLFLHNLGHAVTAYLGYLRGHEYIYQAIGDGRVSQAVSLAMAETCTGLSAKHGLSLEELEAHSKDLVRRFHNKELGDQVARVGADPVRKLGPRDRLVGAALMCLEQGIVPRHTAFAAAAAIRYDNSSDSAAQRIQALRREKGIPGVLEEVCQLSFESPLTQLILEGDQRLVEEGWLH